MANENDLDREDVEFEQAKEDGYYQPAANADDASETQRKGGMAIGAVYALMGSIVVFIVAGYFLDRLFETVWYFTVAGVLLGTVIGFYNFIRITSKNN